MNEKYGQQGFLFAGEIPKKDVGGKIREPMYGLEKQRQAGGSRYFAHICWNFACNKVAEMQQVLSMIAHQKTHCAGSEVTKALPESAPAGVPEEDSRSQSKQAAKGAGKGHSVPYHAKVTTEGLGIP